MGRSSRDCSGRATVSRLTRARRTAPSANEIDGKSSPQHMAAMIKADYATWAEVVRIADIKPQ